MAFPITPTSLMPPKLMAIAQDKYLTPTTPFADPTNPPGIAPPSYGQDISSGMGRKAPGGQSVGTDAKTLKPKMRKLLDIFASGDKSGMSKRLFDSFLADTCRMPIYFDDPALNRAAESHPNIKFFCDAALSAPNSTSGGISKTRIHQALKNANWDITKVYVPKDLGVPAFNLGSKAFSTEDFDNGLGVMINGVQWVYVLATRYDYDATAKLYRITLRFKFYDVFGLDDDDLAEFGAASDSMFSSNAAIGITAWWQLQHQLGYAPLVVRIVTDKTYVVPAQ